MTDERERQEGKGGSLRGEEGQRTGEGQGYGKGDEGRVNENLCCTKIKKMMMVKVK